MQTYDPMDMDQKKAGKIRGPQEKWNVNGRFRVGYHSKMNGRMKARGDVTIGRYCAVGDDCRLIASSHDTQTVNLQLWLQIEVGAKRRGTAKGPIRIGDNVWIGDDVTVLSGVTVGDGAVLATGSIVTRDVAPFAVVAGAPSRHLRYRFHESVRAQLAALRWWEWDEARLKRNVALFDMVIEPDREVDLDAIVVD